MDDNFDICLAFTLKEEGGYSDNPADPGGSTNMGITLATYRQWSDDPNLGIVVAQVQALARRVDEIVVVADRVVSAALPPNASAHSFHARTQLGRGLRLLRAVARELPGLSAVIAHQIPLYAIVMAPLLRPARVPLVLWWSHWKLDSVVRAAEAVSTRVATVGPTTFPRPSRKLVTIGVSRNTAA